MFNLKHFAFFSLFFSLIAGCKLFFDDNIQQKSSQLLDNVNSIILNASEKKDSQQNTISTNENVPENSTQQLPTTIGIKENQKDQENTEQPEALLQQQISELVINNTTSGFSRTTETLKNIEGETNHSGLIGGTTPIDFSYNSYSNNFNITSSYQGPQYEEEEEEEEEENDDEFEDEKNNINDALYWIQEINENKTNMQDSILAILGDIKNLQNYNSQKNTNINTLLKDSQTKIKNIIQYDYNNESLEKTLKEVKELLTLYKNLIKTKSSISKSLVLAKKIKNDWGIVEFLKEDIQKHHQVNLSSFNKNKLTKNLESLLHAIKESINDTNNLANITSSYLDISQKTLNTKTTLEKLKTDVSSLIDKVKNNNNNDYKSYSALIVDQSKGVPPQIKYELKKLLKSLNDEIAATK